MFVLCVCVCVCVCAAKNVILAGVKSVTVHDPDSVEMVHLSSQVSCRISNSKHDTTCDVNMHVYSLNMYMYIHVHACVHSNSYTNCIICISVTDFQVQNTSMTVHV